MSVKVEILPGAYFLPVFNFRDKEFVFIWWSKTSLKNITWERWLIFNLRWPFFRKMELFVDHDNELFYPEEGSWLQKKMKKSNAKP
ncbi:MAG: hypothetical protein PHI12_06600 [Dehalococcoidales bacterium]|nr:hypothetical protein [Dehalococcoidales bacterium]